MGGINLSIHPLFYLLGLYYALTGGIFLFVICTATAVIHELGHSFVASGLGYRLNKITLMPFGAVVSGNTDGLKFIDEVKIALAGPIINVVISLFFIATWWIYPECYAFTDVIVIANLSMAIVNLLPVFPLDGGRIVFASLGVRFGYDRAFRVSRWIGCIFSLLLLIAFIVGVFYKTFNLSLLFFSLFVFFGAISRERENKYVKILGVFDENNLKRGMEIKTHAVHKDMKIKRLMSILDERALNQVEVFDKDKKIASLNQRAIEGLIKRANIYSSIAENLGK